MPITSSSQGSSAAEAMRAIRVVVSALTCTSTAWKSCSLPPRKWW